MVRGHPEIAGLVNWQPLARGGFSTVWQARQETLDRMVAVKVDHRPLGEDRERRRFLREAGSAGRLSGHMGIVTVHDAGILDDGRPYLVMDLCPGGSLTQWLKPEGRQSEQRVRDVGVRIADALAAAHARGVLHRDVKPANILIDAYDHPGLADFGLAALPETGGELSVTLEGMTPAYAPKEVFYLEQPTEFGDVYSLAATLYALLDGKPPRYPDTGTPSPPELLELQRQPIEPLPHVDDELMGVLLGALNDDPSQRPTAAQFRDQLSAVRFTGSSDAPSAGPAAAATAISPSAAAGATSAGSKEAGSALGSLEGPAANDEIDLASLDELDDSTEASGSTRLAAGGRRRRGGALLLLAAAVVAVLALVSFFRWDPTTSAAPGPIAVPATTPADTPSPPASPRPTPPSPTPTVPQLPPGFVDCSEQLGGDSYCLETDQPECWEETNAYADSLQVAEMANCDDKHVHQTFAVGVLKSPANRQSQLEAKKEVKALCNRDVLDRVLAPRKSLKDWKISVIPPQVNIESDNFFRCLFTVPGGKKGAIKLKVLRG